MYNRYRTISLLSPDKAEVDKDCLKTLKTYLINQKLPVWEENKKLAINTGKEEIFSTLYAIIEAAKFPSLMVTLEALEADYINLLQGIDNLNGEQFERVAPYLVKLPPNGKITQSILDDCWGKDCAIFLRSKKSIASLAEHFKLFIRLYDEKEKEKQYFRFFNPRIARDLFPILRPHDYAEIMAGIEQLWIEGKRETQLIQMPD